MTFSAFILLILTHLLFHHRSTTALTPELTRSINALTILKDGFHFSYFLRLVNETRILDQLSDQLNNSDQGMTLLAPTDNAFQNLPPGTLNALTEEKKRTLVLCHILAKFYSMDDIDTVNNPVPTQAGGFSLNFSGRANEVKVSTGVIEAHITKALRKDFPLAVYAIDKVLITWKLKETLAPKGSTGTRSKASRPPVVNPSPEASSPLKTKPANAPSSPVVNPSPSPSPFPEGSYSPLEGNLAKAPTSPIVVSSPSPSPPPPPSPLAKAPSSLAAEGYGSSPAKNGGGKEVNIVGVGLGGLVLVLHSVFVR